MRTSLTPARRLGVVAVSVAIAVLSTDVALADAPAPPGGGAAVDQYREFIPTGGGSVAPGSDTSPPRPLAPSLRADLRRRGGSDAAALERIAISPKLGAPSRPLRATGRLQESGPGAVGAALSAVGASASGDDGSGRLVALVVAMLAIAILGAVAAARRRASSV